MQKCGQEKHVQESADANLIDTLREAVVEANKKLVQANKDVIDTKRRLNEQLQIAARVHRSLLPTAIEHPRILVDVRYLPVDTLSGDYFQVRFSHDPSLCYITMCHVAGDGIAPALLASRISSEARHFIEEDFCPSDMVHALNCFIYEYFRDVAMHVSFMAAQIQLDRRTVTFSGAGHPGGLVLRQGEGLVHRLTSQHCSIGVNPDILIQESQRTLQMAPGDRLFFYADGILHCTDPNHVPLGQNGTADFAINAMSRDLHEMLDAVVHQMRAYRNGPLGTDVAMVVAEIR